MSEGRHPNGTQIHYPCPEPDCGHDGPHDILDEGDGRIQIRCGRCKHEFEVRV